MKKRGLSTVITSLILILLVLVAIGIIWVVVGNLINRSSEQVTIDAFTNNVKIEEAKIGLLKVDIKLTRTQGDAEMTSLKFIFSDGTSSYTYEEQNPGLEALRTKSFEVPIQEIGEVKTISVVPVFGKTLGLEAKKEISESDFDYTIEEDLVAYYKFDGNERDSSGNNYDGVCTGNACPLYTAGKVLQSAVFDGTDDIVEDSQISANVFSESYSVSVWFKFDDWTSDTQAIVQKRNLISTFPRADFILGINKPATLTYPNTGDTCTYSNTGNKIGYMFGEYHIGARCGKWIFSQTEIGAGKWYHVVALYNATNDEAKLYVDDVLEGSATLAIPLPTLMSNLAIGSKPAGVTTNWEFFDGQIDELVIFSKVLLEKEIKQIYESQN